MLRSRAGLPLAEITLAALLRKVGYRIVNRGFKDKAISETGYLMDNLGREAAQFIQQNAKRNWFLYLAFNSVHTPMQAPPETIAKYRKEKPNRNILLSMSLNVVALIETG